jgi:acetyl-CoA carboxylase biotin carboxyl carrier protein
VQFQLIDLKALLTSIKNNNIQQIKITCNSFELMVSKSTITPHNYNKVTSYNILSNETQYQETKKKKVVDNIQIIPKHVESRLPETYFTIVSPMVGTFYRSPAPNEPYFVEIQDKVQANQTVCIIEAMKLMNEIEADAEGEIVEILVEDGEIVDSGQALMKIKPTQL